MCNHLRSCGWKRNVIQSRFDFSASQRIPVCGTTFRVMCVYHHHVLFPAKLGQSPSVVVRIHALILSTSRHGLSPDSILLVQDVAFTSNHHAASRRCGMHHLVCPIIRLVCRPVSKWWRIEPPSSTFLPLWHLSCPVRQLVERPLHGFARFRMCPV